MRLWIRSIHRVEMWASRLTFRLNNRLTDVNGDS